MTTVIGKAQSELLAAQRDLSEGLMTLNSLQTFNTFGCACAPDGACAYHADLANRLLDAMKLVDRVSAELRADLAHPGRAH